MKNSNDYDNFDLQIEIKLNVKKLKKLFDKILGNFEIMREGQKIIDKKRDEIRKKALE